MSWTLLTIGCKSFRSDADCDSLIIRWPAVKQPTLRPPSARGRIMPRILACALLSLSFGFAPLARAEAPVAAEAAIPAATTEQVQQAVDRAITYVQTESASWLNTRKCAACHHAPVAIWALGEAERQG